MIGTKTGRKGALLALALASLSGFGHAQGLSVDNGSAERVSQTAHLRTLSQRIATATCHISVGVSTVENTRQLDSAIAEFGQIIQALRFGDEDLGIIGREQRPQTLRAIDAVSASYLTLSESISDAEKSNFPLDALSRIAAQSADFETAADGLLLEITRQYADDVALLQADALLIDLHNRQALLAASFSKDACYIAAGFGSDAMVADFENTINLFNRSHAGLKDGVPGLGIPTPGGEVLQVLEQIEGAWKAVEPTLTQTIATPEMSTNDLESMGLPLALLAEHVEEAIRLQVENAKLGI